LQLHELRSAEGSPIGAAIENDQRSPSATVCVQIDSPSMLIVQQNVWKPAPNHWADRFEVNDRLGGQFGRHCVSSFDFPPS
jgi:hypothetical protein